MKPVFVQIMLFLIMAAATSLNVYFQNYGVAVFNGFVTFYVLLMAMKTIDLE